MKAPLIIQIYRFVLHLRLHYQFLVLSGGYLAATLIVPIETPNLYWLQFINVHVLLFGGATVYNSYWDKDEGPIGGLKHPPKMEQWMLFGAWVFQLIGVIWAFQVNTLFVVIYSCSAMLFWLYSSPKYRWKGHSWLSMIAIGGSTGLASLLLGTLAAGHSISWITGIAALGVACVMLSLYPASQVYQKEEDEKRGDQTFAIRYGLKGVKLNFYFLFPVGLMALAVGMYTRHIWGALIFFAVGNLIYLVLGFWISRLKGVANEYVQVMTIKFIASFGFVAFILSWLLLQSINTG